MITYTKIAETNINPTDGLNETIVVVKDVVDGSGKKTNESYSFETTVSDATIRITIENDLLSKGYSI